MNKKLMNYVWKGISIIGLFLALYCFYTLFGFVRVCTHVECIDWAVGDDWITENCRPTEEYNDLSCTFKIEDQEFQNIPLKMINVSNPDVRSCKQFVCASEFLGRGKNVLLLKEQMNDLKKSMEVRR